ncbi:hypothetical protein EON63_04720 [archaeon]|nr:MAG: hypothetical protein EON63_04720 [archaeon]
MLVYFYGYLYAWGMRFLVWVYGASGRVWYGTTAMGYKCNIVGVYASGLLTFLDPPRPDTKHTIDEANR